jgi:type VI secretion system secreted protein VgrG
MSTPDSALVQLLWGAAHQRDRLLRLHTPLGGDVLVPDRFEGWEAVDHGGFRFELATLSPNAHIPLERLLGAPVLLELLTADSRTDLRPFHAHVSGIERVGSNAGLARYRLTLEPWLALLKLRQDSFAFRDATVIEIVEQLFAHYARGVVVPAWRWQLADRSLYLKRSLTTQYQESDFAFVERLLAEEGLFYWFEHAGDPAAPTLGTHTLVLADSNEAFEPGEALTWRYHRSNATERDDTIQRWAPVRRWQTGQALRASWDYRTRSLRPAQAQAEAPAVAAVDDDTAGPYAWPNPREGERRARQHLDALHADSARVDGAGSVRRLAPGQCFRLSQHPTQDDTPLACLRVEHRARNNLDAEVMGAAERTLGADFAPFDGPAWDTPWPKAAAKPKMQPQTHADAADDPLYTNTFVAQPVARPYRPHTAEGHGLRRQPVPTATGAHSAVVVGDGAPIHTDRDHRVIVQQHWQRGENAASRLDHPRTPNAPADGSAGTWARVSTPLAGANWGSAMLPRVGQEVWLNYLEGDIDRPVVVASLYNGRGNPDAPYNQAAGGPAGATGNAPAWFTGNAHPGVLCGIKSQDLATSADGSGGYRQLRLDDTPQQGHAQLATTDYDSALTLGHVKYLIDNRRVTDLGYGAALSSLAQGALRAGNGLLVATGPGSAQMDAAESGAVLDQGRQLVQGLTEAAQHQQAGLPGEPSAEKLHATDSLAELSVSLAGTRRGTEPGGGIGGGEGTVPAWNRPDLIAHGHDGLAAVTPRDHVWVAGTDAVLSAGQDLDLAAQGKLSFVADEGIALYAQGNPGGARPVAQTGIALHAASGKATLQAQHDKAEFLAQGDVTLASTQASVKASAKRSFLLAAGGAYLKLDGTNIEIGAPGAVQFKAGGKSLSDPRGGGDSAGLGSAVASECEIRSAAAAAAGDILVEL